MRTARREGRRESEEAHGADALAQIVRSHGTATSTPEVVETKTAAEPEKTGESGRASKSGKGAAAGDEDLATGPGPTERPASSEERSATEPAASPKDSRLAGARRVLQIIKQREEAKAAGQGDSEQVSAESEVERSTVESQAHDDDVSPAPEPVVVR